MTEVRQVVDVQTVELTAEQRAALTGNPPVQADDWTGDEAPNPRALELRDRWIAEELELLAGVSSEFNFSLFRCAAALWRWVTGTGLSQQWAQAALEAECARRWGRPDRADRQTIASGRKAGSSRPREWPRGSAEIERIDTLTGEVLPPVAASAAGAQRPRTLAEAVAAGAPWISRAVNLSGGGRVEVVYNPGTTEHGTWATQWKPGKSATDPGEEIRVRVTDYLVRRAEERIEDAGNGSTEATYRCEVIDQAGRAWRTDWLSALDSQNPGRVVALSRARVAPPSSSGADASVLRGSLGAICAGEMAASYPVHQAGWGVDRTGQVEGPVFYAPAGSITADGPRVDLAGEPPRAVGEVRRAVIDGTGWDRVSGRIGEMADAILEVAPGAEVDHMPGALLGMAALAPLRSEKKGSLFLVGRTDSGKTTLAKAARALVSSVPWGSGSWPANLPADRAAAMRIYARWSRDLLLIADDLASGDSDQARQAISFVDEQSKASLAETDGGGRSAPDARTLRGTDSASCPLLVTMERLPATEGVANRAMHFEIEGIEPGPSTLDLAEGGGVDVFRDQWAHTGEARAAWAGYLTWLARQMRDGTELAPRGTPTSLGTITTATWAREYSRLKAALPAGTTRSVELATSVSVGWIYLRAYAESVSEEQARLMPPQDTVDEWLEAIVTASRTGSGSLAPGRQIIEWVAAQLASRRGRVEAHDGKAPVALVTRIAMGWPSDGSQGGGVPILGRLSRDGSHIVLNSAVTGLARAGLEALRPTTEAELRDRLRREADADLLTATGNVSRSLGVGNMRGYPVPLARFGIDLDATDAQSDAQKAAA